MTTEHQREYLRQYKKDNLKQFKVDLRIEEYDKIDKYLREHNITKAQFLRDTIDKIIKK